MCCACSVMLHDILQWHAQGPKAKSSAVNWQHDSFMAVKGWRSLWIDAWQQHELHPVFRLQITLATPLLGAGIARAVCRWHKGCNPHAVPCTDAKWGEAIETPVMLNGELLSHQRLSLNECTIVLNDSINLLQLSSSNATQHAWPPWV